MLENLDAEKFCSGHSDPTDRNAVEHHVEEIKTLQGKIKNLIEQGKDLEEIKGAFEDNHSRLVESIFNEIKSE